MNVCCLKLKKHVTVCLLHDHPNLICHKVRFCSRAELSALGRESCSLGQDFFSVPSSLTLGSWLSLFTPLSVWGMPDLARAENTIPGAACWGSSILSTHIGLLFFFLRIIYLSVVFYCKRPYFASVAHYAGVGRATSVSLNLKPF